MSRTKAALSGSSLLVAAVLAIAGCGSSGGSGTVAASQPRTAVATAASGAASGSGGGAAGNSCSHGLQPGANGVVDIACDGPGTIRITAGSVSESIAGGTCRQAGITWTVTAGVITR